MKTFGASCVEEVHEEGFCGVVEGVAESEFVEGVLRGPRAEDSPPHVCAEGTGGFFSA